MASFLQLTFAVAVLTLVATASSPSDSLAKAAQYYFERRDYKHALQLWEEVLKKRPQDVAALLRISEIKLHFEGRKAFRDTLVGFLDKSELSPELKEIVKQKLTEIQNRFLTDEGQSFYLQAIAKIDQKNCEGAIPLLDKAHQLEQGNLRVLIQKANCEKESKLLEKYYATMESAHLQDPFDAKLQIELAEAHLYFGNPAKVVSIFEKEQIDLSQIRESVAFGWALLDSGKIDEAKKIFQKVLANQNKDFHPIVLFALGKILSVGPTGKAEAISYLNGFLAASARADISNNKVWDPYKTETHIAEAKKLLASLRSEIG